MGPLSHFSVSNLQSLSSQNQHGSCRIRPTIPRSARCDNFSCRNAAAFDRIRRVSRQRVWPRERNPGTVEYEKFMIPDHVKELLEPVPPYQMNLEEEEDAIIVVQGDSLKSRASAKDFVTAPTAGNNNENVDPQNANVLASNGPSDKHIPKPNRCNVDGCPREALFLAPNGTTRVRCQVHAGFPALLVQQPSQAKPTLAMTQCREAHCKKIVAFDRDNLSTAFCEKHKKPPRCFHGSSCPLPPRGPKQLCLMHDKATNVCSVSSCDMKPIFVSLPGFGELYCLTHAQQSEKVAALPGFKLGKCWTSGCRFAATYEFPGFGWERCVAHALKGMERHVVPVPGRPMLLVVKGYNSAPPLPTQP